VVGDLWARRARQKSCGVIRRAIGRVEVLLLGKLREKPVLKSRIEPARNNHQNA
jgi:hypothetical protein